MVLMLEAGLAGYVQIKLDMVLSRHTLPILVPRLTLFVGRAVGDEVGRLDGSLDGDRVG